MTNLLTRAIDTISLGLSPFPRDNPSRIIYMGRGSDHIENGGSPFEYKGRFLLYAFGDDRKPGLVLFDYRIPKGKLYAGRKTFPMGLASDWTRLEIYPELGKATITRGGGVVDTIKTSDKGLLKGLERFRQYVSSGQ